MKTHEILFLSQEDVIQAGILDMEMVVPTMEEVYSLHDKDDYILPTKCVLRWGDMESESTRGRINAMPGWIGGDIQAVGIKWISSSPKNPFKHNLPRASAVMVLNDPVTLLPIAIFDGTAISAARTGANTGVGAKYLAKKESKILGIIGAGVQSYTQLLAVHHVYPNLDEIKIYDLDVKRSKNFALSMGEKTGKRIEVVDSAYDAVKGSDIFITATVTKEPIIKKDWIEPGVFYCHVGSHECDFDAIMQFNKKVVDDWNEIKHRGVESLAIMQVNGMISDSDIYAELGEIVNGKKPGRETDTETIYMNTVGLGIQDVAVAQKIYNNAIEMDIGKRIKLWESPFAI